MGIIGEVVLLAKKAVKKKNTPKNKTVKKKKKKPKKTRQVSIKISIIKAVPEKDAFILADGRKLKDLRELAFALGDMGDEIFWHHVNDARNDFANWVEGAFDDKKLAGNLNKIKDKISTQIAILKHIVDKL